MFLAKEGEYDACGIFEVEHFILIAITVIGIIFALKCTVNKADVQKVIKKCTVFLWICEVIIIAFKVITGGFSNVNNYVPLYYCSLLLYAGLLSSFAKGTLKKIGDVFLSTGAIIGGIVFIFFPTTSLLTYPAFHLVSIHSFVYHGIMIYLGLLVNLTNYIQLESKDIIYYFSLISVICIIAYVVNKTFNGNLMFISENFPGTFIEPVYKFTGKFFTFVMMLGQSTLPFYVIYGARKLICRKQMVIE